MRIISKFHDYYDSAMSYGQDQTVVFTRTTEQVDLTEDEFNRFPAADLYHHIRGNKNYKLKMTAVFFCFSGKTYRSIQVRIWDRRDGDTEYSPVIIGDALETRYFYDVESLREFLAKYKFEINLTQYSWQNKQEPVITEFLSKQGTDENEKWLIERKFAIISVVRSGTWNPSRFAPVYKHQAELNPVLKDVEFYKVLDSFTAYQELDMFISGTLPQSTAMPIEIADKDKIPQHGFDKWSFRKMPDGK
jgi:hypothetical protein